MVNPGFVNSKIGKQMFVFLVLIALKTLSATTISSDIYFMSFFKL